MKKNIQVLLSEDEMKVVDTAAAVSGVTNMRGYLSIRMRSLLLAWAHSVVGTRGLVRGGTCYDCQNSELATWLIAGNRKYVCDTCAARRNATVPDACLQSGPDSFYLPVQGWEAAWERTIAIECERRAGGKRSELVVALSDAAVALVDYDRGVKSPETGNADLVGLFKQP